jgi:hypothetical protein
MKKVLNRLEADVDYVIRRCEDEFRCVVKEKK